MGGKMNKNYYVKRVQGLVLMILLAMLSLLTSPHAIAAFNIQQSAGALVLTVKDKFQKTPLPFAYTISKIDKGKIAFYSGGASKTGNVSMKIMSGSYKIRIVPSNTAYKSEELVAQINSGRITTLEVLADYKGGTETVKVTVQDTNGEPIVQAVITLSNKEQNTSEAMESSNDGVVVFANKNLDYIYSLEVKKKQDTKQRKLL
jgi:VCBS repeat-containing protein